MIILGGGVAGLTMANLLAQNTALNVTLIEAQQPDFTWDPKNYDLRCSAINQATQQVFAELGIWDSIKRERVGSYTEMLVWDKDFSSQVKFNHAAGYIVENRLMQRELLYKLQQCNNVRIIYDRPQKLEILTDSNKIYLANTSLTANLIIGADGANSWLRQAAGLKTNGWTYQDLALVATVHTENSHNNIARQRFTPDGPLAFLPLQDPNLCSIVWSVAPQKINELLAINQLDFGSILAENFSNCLGKISLHGARASYPLKMLHTKSYIAPRLALIGDAAHVVHPLAGQGLNLGINDVIILTNLIATSIKNQQDIGSVKILRKYERTVKSHNVAAIAMIEIFKQMFAINDPMLQRIRSFGMQKVNNLNWLKQKMIDFATGIR